MLFSCSKELVGNTPKTDLISLKASFSVVLSRSRQQLSFRDIETSSEFLLHYTHRLSASASNLFPWLQTQRLLFPLQWEVKEHLLPHGCLLHCLTCLHTAPAHRAGSILGTHQVHIWLCHPLSGSQIQCGQIPSAAGVSWGFNRVEVTGGNESCKLFSATRDSGLRKFWSVKTLSVHRTIIILNVFRNRNRKCKRVKFSSPWQNGNGKFHLFHNQNIFYTYAAIFVNITTTNRGE